MLPRYIITHFSEPILVEPFAKFRRGKSVQQRIDRTIQRQDKNHYPGVQIGYKFHNLYVIIIFHLFVSFKFNCATKYLNLH